MFDFGSIAAVTVIFLIAGAVKGVIGLGLPTISLALLTLIFDLPTAMATLLLPSFVTNLWQAMVGGNGRRLLNRLWPFLLPAMLLVWTGGMGLSILNPAFLSGILGLLLITYATLALKGIRPVIDPRAERWAGPLLGGINGVFTGLTGSFVVPGTLYLQAIGLPRDQLVQAMGILFTLSTIALAASLGVGNFLSADLGAVSAIAVGPALAGMVVGQKVRKWLSEATFRSVFFWSILMLGLFIVARAAG